MPSSTIFSVKAFADINNDGSGAISLAVTPKSFRLSAIPRVNAFWAVGVLSLARSRDDGYDIA